MTDVVTAPQSWILRHRSLLSFVLKDLVWLLCGWSNITILLGWIVYYHLSKPIIEGCTTHRKKFYDIPDPPISVFIISEVIKGNHFRVITFFGRSIIGRSDSNFHKTFCGNSLNPSLSPYCIEIGKSSILTTDPKLKYITPCSELSMNSCRSCTIKCITESGDLLNVKKLRSLPIFCFERNLILSHYLIIICMLTEGNGFGGFK
ncbi:hypothetical protein AGLY_012639 [Aphis glycines]|uniref:Uncharacterized protein n=1 Tax=Aphis glycines TaxID=307491 RepID=A0A6G0T8Y8_APHGL|nr:hypothetical protein AGLY_012639 [Aphis glycines]